MGNKRSKSKKPKQNKGKAAGRGQTERKGGSSQFDDIGSPSPVKKKKRNSKSRIGNSKVA